MRRLLLALLISVLLAAPATATPPRASLSALDLIALEIAYTTILARYYKPVEPVALLRGARGGVVAYLASRGIAHAQLPEQPSRADRYAAENAIARDVALSVARYGTRIRTVDLVRRAIAGELGALHDPYSVLFEPRQYHAFVGFLDGRATAGIGAELDVDPQSHVVRVVDVFPGAPAADTGLAPGDTIVALDGRAPGATAADVAAALRGAPGTVVHVAFERDGVRHEPLAIVRRAIAPPDVTGRIVRPAVGLVRIRSCGAQAPSQLAKVLDALRASGARAFVLDLRNDGGGYRDAAIALASRFVHGTIVTTQERSGPPRRFPALAAPAFDAPLAVLVDRDTASAAEIIAAAVQDAHAGTLIGTRTFGKGLVQETYPLPDGGAIKLTTARYVTAGGRDIEGVGVAPDIVVAPSADEHPGLPGADPPLDRALALLGDALRAGTNAPPPTF
ncbi:MAG: PDZ domain-containing protein [Candidatus Eremiobacteraeota bacterium]|nr:PDZ domain-containing protein [Candidatus Eremiobacteraeota bacterium]